MLKVLLLFLMMIVTLPAFAGKDCLALLTFGETKTAFNNSELTAASSWLQTPEGGKNPTGFDAFLLEQNVDPSSLSESQREDWLARYALNQWDKWRRVSKAQRHQALALELKKISPAREENSFYLDGAAQLARLSQSNLARLLSVLNERYPLSPAVVQDAALIQQAENMAKNLTFHYLRSYRPKKESGVHGPIASPRELQRFGLSDPLDFYSALVDISPSVGFDLVATNSTQGLYNIGALVAGDSVRVNSEFAGDAGFILPRVGGVLDLIHLFSFWDPEALDGLLNDLKFSLPNGISNTQELRRYLTPNRLQLIVPESSLYQRLAALRTRLSQFALSELDAQAFLRQAFVQFLLSEASRNPKAFQEYVAKFGRIGGAQEMISTDLMDFLAFKGVSLRVPVAVSNYSIIRREPAPRSRLKRTNQEPWDSRRLDRPLAP